MPTTLNGRMRGIAPATVMLASGASKVTGSPRANLSFSTSKPKRRANSTPSTMLNSPSFKSAKLPWMIFFGTSDTLPSWVGSMPSTLTPTISPSCKTIDWLLMYGAMPTTSLFFSMLCANGASQPSGVSGAGYTCTCGITDNMRSRTSC